MFGFFERLVDPFPGATPEQPPRGIYQFCRYYMRGMERWLMMMGILDGYYGSGRGHADWHSRAGGRLVGH